MAGNVRLYGSSGYIEVSPQTTSDDSTLVLPNGGGTLATQGYADNAGGLVHITTQSFSAVSAVSLNGCFTSTYTNYRIVILLTAGGTISMRLRASASDITAANYRDQNINAFNGSNLTSAETSAQTAWASVCQFDTLGIASMDIFQPQVADDTGLMIFSGKTRQVQIVSALYTAATQADGFSIYPASGTITGSVRVYGYLNS